MGGTPGSTSSLILTDSEGKRGTEQAISTAQAINKRAGRPRLNRSIEPSNVSVVPQGALYQPASRITHRDLHYCTAGVKTSRMREG